LLGINIHRHLPRDPTLENNHEDQQETARPAVLPETTIISDHPCDLGFDEFLAPQQRLQYEKEMFRTISSKYNRNFLLKFFHIFIFYKNKDQQEVVFSFKYAKNQILNLTQLFM
jgi:hypothetical protein